MKDWYELTQNLETETAPLDELTSARIESRVRAALPCRRRRPQLIAALIAMLLLSACGYAAISQYSHWFWNYAENPRSPETSEDLLASMGTAIGQSQTVDGITATLHGALVDDDTLLLSLTVEGEPVPALIQDIDSEDTWLYPTPQRIEQQTRTSFPYMTEEEVKDYAAEFWEANFQRFSMSELSALYHEETNTSSLQVESPLFYSDDTQELILHLENLHLDGETSDGNDVQLLVEGPFEFTFTVERKDVRQVWFGEQEILLAERVPVQVSKITISPLHVSVKFAGVEKLPVKGGFGDLEQLEYEHNDCLISALRISGVEIPISTDGSSSGNSAGPDGSWSGAVHAELPRAVDPATVEAVCIGGIWLELEEFSLMESGQK